MRALWLIPAILFAALGVSWAQLPWQSGVGTPTAYVGPIDVIASPKACYSLRACSGAIAAAGTQSIVDLRRSSDNATCTAIVATSGGVDLTVGTPCNSSTQTVTAWTNNDSSCTGAIATTTLTVASCTKGNLHVGLPITDANITAGTFITALGTGSGGAGTYTVNISQTAASATFTAPGWAFISKWYDQAINAGDVVQATSAAQPVIVYSCLSALPCVAFSRASSQQLRTAANVGFNIPFTGSSVAIRTGSVTSYDDIAFTQQHQFGFANLANNAFIYGNVQMNAPATDNVWHAIQGVTNSGGTSDFYIDGTHTSTGGGGAGPGSHPVVVGSDDVSGNFMDGNIAEVVLYTTNISAGQAASMNTNQHAYWAF
jgi:hypothetical protein